MRVFRRRWPVIVLCVVVASSAGVDRHGGDVRAGGPCPRRREPSTRRRSCCGIPPRRSVGAIRSRIRRPSHVSSRGRTSPRSRRRYVPPGSPGAVAPPGGSRCRSVDGLPGDHRHRERRRVRPDDRRLIHPGTDRLSHATQDGAEQPGAPRAPATDGDAGRERRQTGRDRGPAQAASSTRGRTDHPGLVEGVRASRTHPTSARGRHRRPRRPNTGSGCRRAPARACSSPPCSACSSGSCSRSCSSGSTLGSARPNGPRRRSGCPSSPRSPRSLSGVGRAW